jgi:hypothetical protein
MQHWPVRYNCRAGQNLADASKLGYVELDTGREGGGQRHPRTAQNSATRRVSLEGSMMNHVLQQDHCAANRQRARTLSCHCHPPFIILVFWLEPWGVRLLGA